MGLQVTIQTVQSHHPQQRTALQLFLGQIGEVGAGGVALVLDVELELLLLHIRGQVVHVLHHQSPVALCGTALGVLQGLDEEHLTGLCLVTGKLTHLIGLSVVGVLESHGQHLIGLQASLQRDVAQRCIHRVFARVEQAGRGQFLIVGATVESGHAFERSGHDVDAARGRVDGIDERLVFVVGLVAGDVLSHSAPHRVTDIFSFA